MYFRSFLAKETLITMADSSTKPIEELVEGDKIQTYNQNSKNYDGAHLENNEQVPGIITKLGKELVQRSDTVKVTLSNGSKIVITKDYPLVGGGKTAGWQIYDAFMYVKNYIGKTVTSNEELEDIIKPMVSEINEMHAGIHPEATEWYASGQPPNERADTTKLGSMHPSGRQSGNFPGRLGVGKRIYCDDGETLSLEEIVSLEELSGDEKKEMYCVGWVNSGHTMFANRILVGAGKSTAERGNSNDPYKVDDWDGEWYKNDGKPNLDWKS